jgi:hypothetical protein
MVSWRLFNQPTAIAMSVLRGGIGGRWRAGVQKRYTREWSITGEGP